MSSTQQVLGMLGAMQTLIENFPMSLLDLFRGKTYTSAFEFIIDVLRACGVNTNEIIELILRKVYAIEADLTGGIEVLQHQIVNNQGEIGEQSEFLKAMEESIKVILMGLLTSVFTCSALPIIPNKYMDKPRKKSYLKDGEIEEKLILWEIGRYPDIFRIPINYIDPMGIFEINPTSSDGKLYYNIEGKDTYYKKVENIGVSTAVFGSTGTKVRSEVNSFIEINEKKDKLIFKIDKPILTELNISVGYVSYNNQNLNVWSTKIEIGNTESNKNLPLLAKGKNGHTSTIKWISINGCEEGYTTKDGVKVLFSKELSKSAIDYWNSLGAFSLENNIKWANNEAVVLGTGDEEDEEIEDEPSEEEITYCYVPDSYNKNYLNATRYSTVPELVRESHPDYIIVYDGISPNSLYKSYDMNAFLWYCIKKGTIVPTIEYNHMMWDSRLSAKVKHNITLDTLGMSWNQWYESKKESSGNCEFTYNSNEPILESDNFYPILQIKPTRSGYYALDLSFPSQRYFKPKLRERILTNADSGTDDEDKPKGLSYAWVPNASIYRFDWEYLQSIQILKPRQMLAGLCRYLLGFALSTASSVDINFTRKLIEKKLATAIKNIVEADDMQVEDCFMSFSNDDFNSMLEEMNLSRYNATYKDGDTSTARVHDVKDYMNQINNVNANATQEGSITAIKKLVNDVTVTPAEGDYEIAYGMTASMDGNLLNKLIWAIIMPIAESLFSPQVMLLLMINFGMMGIVNLESIGSNDAGLIMNMLFNKVMGLLKSIIKYIKDMIIEILLRFLYEKILPMILKYKLLLFLEKLQYWLEILKAALACVPVFKFKRTKMLNAIDEVDYADIINNQDTPESTATC